MKHVLVVFQAAEKGTENLALAFGLGAVEGGSDIRLRHLAGDAAAHLEHQGYGRLSDGDVEWAEVIGLGIETAEPAGELVAFLEQVKGCRERAGEWKKFAYVFGGAEQTASIGLARETLAGLGFSMVEPQALAAGDGPEPFKAAGRYAAQLAWD